MIGNAHGRVGTPIVTRDAAVPVAVRLGAVVRVAVVTATVVRDVEVGNTRRAVATEMVEIATGNGEEMAEVQVDDGKEVARVAVEDVVVRTEIRYEPVERTPRPSTEPPDRHCSCTAIISNC